MNTPNYIQLELCGEKVGFKFNIRQHREFVLLYYKFFVTDDGAIVVADNGIFITIVAYSCLYANAFEKNVKPISWAQTIEKVDMWLAAGHLPEMLQLVDLHKQQNDFIEWIKSIENAAKASIETDKKKAQPKPKPSPRKKK